MMLTNKHKKVITILLLCLSQSFMAYTQQIAYDSSIVMKAGPEYKASAWKRFWFGDHYRDVWCAPVQVPVVNIDKTFDGLSPVERGGGQQTISLKLKGGNERLYTFRSIQKDPTEALPKILRPTIADKVVQDQISAEHPYGAFILPYWLDTLGLYHTNPVLVVIPDHPRLGPFREQFAGMLAMLEEDADENWEDKASFGYTENAVSTETMLEDLLDDNDNSYDEWFLTKGRLFDIWIGDWDRHDGQWRWAEFEKEDKGLLFRQIPEDRDNAFFKFDGLLPSLMNRKWAIRKFQSFDTTIRDMKGLNYNARYFDRTFLTELELDDWLAIADTMQQVLTDEVIEHAVHQWPDTVYNLSGDEIIQKLKIRRDKLKDFAARYYHILASSVDIRGSNKHELFKVKRINDDSLKVEMYKIKKEGTVEKLLYKRIFKTDETKEVRLYGFEGEDRFEIEGQTDRSILVRIIGGEERDIITDSSSVKGWRKMTRVYDSETGNELRMGSETKDLTSKELEVNVYDRKAFKYNYYGPLVDFGFNIDDGLFLGGGTRIVTHGFRKIPFATKHQIKGKASVLTGAFQFGYDGVFKQVVKNMDINVKLDILAPRYQTNFFGLGNETKAVFDEDDRYYTLRYNQVRLAPSLHNTINDRSFFAIGPNYQYIKVQNEANRFISSEAAQLSFNDFQPQHFGGLFFEFEYNSSDYIINPEMGVKWNTTGSWQFELQDQPYNFSKLTTALSFYYTFDLPLPTTVAFRAGGATIVGDYPFHQAASLGGSSNLGEHGTLRGFRRDRFAGRSAFYQNSEIRLELTEFQSFFVTGKLGVLGIMDQGRVWVDEETSDLWHRSYGGGVWITPFYRWVIAATYHHSTEENIVNINLDFAF